MTATRKIHSIAALSLGVLFAGLALAQDEPVIDPSQVVARTAAPQALAAGHPISGSISGGTVSPALPLWQYNVVSPRDGNAYTGSVVGGNPFNRGARTTTVNVVLIPLKVIFTGTVRTFDPSAPDTACLGLGNTALSLTQQSPIFNTVPNLTMDGVNLGNVSFVDGFQRANFWSSVSSVAPAYHMAFNLTTAPTQTMSLPNNFASGSGGTVTFAGDTYCGKTDPTAVNPNRTGAIDINFVDAQLQTIITNLGLNANQFPLFITYGIVMTDGPPATGGCCILGYHSSFTNAPPSAPGQTYGIAEYDTGQPFGGTIDISVISHEVLEWVNDPSGNNLVPEWGNIGQVGGCQPPGPSHSAGQNNLEVGDPLSGSLNPSITMPNLVTYHPQELAFYSWFIGGPSLGAGGKYSSNGTFMGFAKNCAAGGGTN
jgi:hypothetical protein